MAMGPRWTRAAYVAPRVIARMGRTSSADTAARRFMCRRSARPAAGIRMGCRRALTALILSWPFLHSCKRLRRFRSRGTIYRAPTSAATGSMFLRLVADSFTRRPRRKVLTAAALSLGMAVVTAALSVSLDVGDRLASEFRSLGANLLVTPQADSLLLEIGGVDYRPVNAGAYLPEADLPKIKTVFWHNNIIAFAPMLELQVEALPLATQNWIDHVSLIGTWADHAVPLPDGGKFQSGIAKTNPWWQIDGRWFSDDAKECVVGATFAQKNHVKIGDSISLATGAVTKIPSPLKVTGILSSGGPR